MPSFVARTHQARSALLCGTKHFGVPSVSPDSSLIPPSGSNLTRQLVSELRPQLGYCVGSLIPSWQSHERCRSFLIQRWPARAEIIGLDPSALLLEFKDLIDQGLLKLPAPEREMKEINPKE
jgi:hypothetical protein